MGLDKSYMRTESYIQSARENSMYPLHMHMGYMTMHDEDLDDEN